MAEADVRADAELVGAATQVVADLRLWRVGLTPIGVGCEGERVEVRGDVARAAGIGVEPPGPAHLVAPLDHQEVVEPLLLEADRGAEAREAAPHDQDVDLGRGCVPAVLDGRGLQCCGHLALLVFLSPVAVLALPAAASCYVPVTYRGVTLLVLRWPH